MDSEKDSTSAKQATAVSGYPSTAAKKRPRIVIADDDPRVLAEIGNFLGTDFDVVGHASNGRELLETVKRLNPALVVADLAMPEMGGLEVQQRDRRAQHRGLTSERQKLPSVYLRVAHSGPNEIFMTAVPRG